MRAGTSVGDAIEDFADAASISRSGASPLWWVRVSIVTKSPGATVRTGSRRGSKQPRWTVDGVPGSRWTVADAAGLSTIR